MAAHLTSLGPQGGVAFLAEKQGNTQDDFTVTTWTPVVYGTERFDTGGNWDGTTFTAPVTGKYQFCLEVRFNLVDVSASYYHTQIATSNHDYYTTDAWTSKLSGDPLYTNIGISICADLDVNDTAVSRVYQASGYAQTDIGSVTIFSGFLCA
jgi:hypothetical protein